MGGIDGDGDISRLPEGCISHVLSLTTPRDACRSAAVSPVFRSAAASDTVWGRFVPSDHSEIVSRAVDPVVGFPSKRDLYFRFCEPVLLDGGKMSFSLEMSTGKKIYMLSARELSITWGDTPRYWQWIQLPDSRFSEVAELLDVCWLEVRGKLDTRVLSPQTKYAAYLIFKLAHESRGLSSPVQETSVKVGNHVSTNVVRLQNDERAAKRETRSLTRHLHLWRHLNPQRRRASVLFGTDDESEELIEVEDDESEEELIEEEDVPRAPHPRSDGWMEIEMGEFYNEDGDDGEVEMSLLEVKGGNWKRGLIVQGIEVRPKL